MTTAFWTVVRLPLFGRHYDPRDVVTDGLLHVSREAALESLRSSLVDSFEHMGYAVTAGYGTGTFNVAYDSEVCNRVDGPDSTFISYPDFECAYLVARLSLVA